MHPNPNSLEIQVAQTLRQLLDKYVQLDEIADAMIAKQAQQQDIVNDLRQLDNVKKQITDIEATTHPVREQYRNQMPAASAEVKELTRQATERLTAVREKIDRLESHVREAYGKLAPSIDQGVRASQMQRAYGR